MEVILFYQAGCADDEGLERFSELDEGAALVSEWGHEAQQRIGLIQRRLMQIEANADAGEVDAMWAWFDGLPSFEAKAVLKALAS